MAIQPKILKREFNYGGLTIPDPNPDMSEQQCLEVIAVTYPELTNAKIEPPEIVDGTKVFAVKPVAARKG